MTDEHPHSIPITPPEELLSAYLSGTLDRVQAERVDAWLRSTPEAELVIQRFMRGATGLGSHVAPPSARELTTSIHERIVRERQGANATLAHSDDLVAARPQLPHAAIASAPISSRSFIPRSVAIIAGLAAVALVGWIGARQYMEHRTTASDVYTVRYATQVGQQAQITFTDGSRAILAPMTTLRVQDGFGVHSRTVLVEGEAYFDVRDNQHTPFIVKAGGAVTRVLGTTFNVQSYPDDNMVRVAVTSGKVSFTPRRSKHILTSQTASTPLVLSAGMTSVATDSSVNTESNGSASAESAWISGHIMFRNAPVSQVLAALTRWYGYRFQLSDSSIARQDITISLSTESSNDALASLKTTLEMDLSVSGMVISIHPKQRVRRDAPLRRERDLITTPTVEVGR